MSSSNQNKNILIVAGEASSAHYAVKLLRFWKEQNLGVSAFGVGSSEMESEGFERVGKSEEMAVVGLQEIFSAWDKISTAFKSLVSLAEKRRPCCAILMDYPDFNLRLAKKLKKLGIPVIYYISPQVWAWRQGRVKTIRKVVDHMLVLFPFEEEFYRQHEVKAQFVGHPLLEDVMPELLSREKQLAERERFGISSKSVLLGLMPGSRKGEIQHHLEVQINAARDLKKKLGRQVDIALLVAPTLDVEALKAKIQNLDISLTIVKQDPFQMIAMCDVILCASGTATLMVGLMKKPMVIMYKAHPLTVLASKVLVPKLKNFGLSNILLGHEQSKELFQDNADCASIVKELTPLLTDEKLREQHATELARLHTLLGEKGATARVTEVVKEHFK